jgi:hypothetical protein
MGAVMEAALSALEGLKHWLRKLGPLLLVEILLPGGTLVALMLLFYERRREQARASTGTEREPQRDSAVNAALACVYR